MGQNNRNKFASNQVTLKIATSLASLRLHPSAFHSTHAFALHVWPFLTPELQQAPIPSSHHKSGSLNNKGEYNSTSQSTARKSAANVRTPSVTSSEPLPKRPENLSGATAVVFLGCVHLGRRRDQLLDHGGVAFQSRLMQRRLASGAEDATRKAGLLRHRGETKRSNGMFLRVVGQIFLDRS